MLPTQKALRQHIEKTQTQIQGTHNHQFLIVITSYLKHIKTYSNISATTSSVHDVTQQQQHRNHTEQHQVKRYTLKQQTIRTNVGSSLAGDPPAWAAHTIQGQDADLLAAAHGREAEGSSW